MARKIRKYQTIQGYDYSTKEEFEKHKIEMQKKGFFLLTSQFDGILKPSELCGSDDYKYTANYIKSPMF